MVSTISLKFSPFTQLLESVLDLQTYRFLVFLILPSFMLNPSIKLSCNIRYSGINWTWCHALHGFRPTLKRNNWIKFSCFYYSADFIDNQLNNHAKNRVLRLYSCTPTHSIIILYIFRSRHANYFLNPVYLRTLGLFKSAKNLRRKGDEKIDDKNVKWTVLNNIIVWIWIWILLLRRQPCTLVARI